MAVKLRNYGDVTCCRDHSEDIGIMTDRLTDHLTVDQNQFFKRKLMANECFRSTRYKADYTASVWGTSDTRLTPKNCRSASNVFTVD